MSFFTEQDRSDILEQLIIYLKSRDEVLSVILVGSGADGFRDRLSDIDLTIVIDSKTDIDTFISEYQSCISNRFNIMINHRVPGRPLAITVLDNFLEIDMSAVYLDDLFAVRNIWRVLFDKTEQAEIIMEKTSKSRLSVDHSGLMDNEFKAAEWGFWHYIIYAATSIRRNDLWRAHWEMGYVRDMIIQLLGLKYGLETKRNRDVKLFPAEALERLQKTIPQEFTTLGFAVALKDLTDLIYDIFDEHFDKSQIEFPREKMEEYLSFALEGIHRK